jgi:hypothetical protein
MGRVAAVVIALALAMAGASADDGGHHAKHDYHVYPAKLSGRTFKSLDAAKAACGKSPVVWLNPTGVVFHTATSRWFGHTSTGVYTCRDAAEAAGYWKSKY